VRTERGNGRQSAHNFDYEDGQEYQVEGEPLKEDETYVLCTSQYLDSHRRLVVHPDHHEARISRGAELEASKCRRIRKSWAIASIQGEGELYWVIFEHKGNHALACLAFASSSGFATLDFEGEANRGDIWRVGDGGEPTGVGFTILLATLGPTGLEFAYEWMGEEGTSISYVRQKGAKLLEVEGTGTGRYLVPI
jgi:hypothetical protein